jgi:hypothetical protein
VLHLTLAASTPRTAHPIKEYVPRVKIDPWLNSGLGRVSPG